MTSNSIGFYPGTYVTTMFGMVTVGLTVSEKSPGQTNKQTNIQTDKDEKTIVAVRLYSPGNMWIYLEQIATVLKHTFSYP